MAIFRADCPHCGIQQVAFQVINNVMITDQSGQKFWDILARCGGCDYGVVAAFDIDSPRTTPTDHSRLIPHSLLKIVPEPPDTSAPDHTPPHVASFFKQGANSLQQRNFDAAGSMFRKALETSLKSKFPEISAKLNLYKRIDKAVENHDLTPDMGKWAHEIRDLGNDAAHDEVPFSGEEAQALHDFTRLVLMYLFTLPGMVPPQEKTGTV